jgi:hypothetical protein
MLTVGFPYGAQGSATEIWIVAFGDVSLTQDDVEFISSLFPSRIQIEIWTGVKGYSVQPSAPPIIQLHCK